MDTRQNASIKATPEQVLYASILEKGMYIGLLVLFITFAVYAFGLMDPYIPMSKLSDYWTMGVNEYLEKAHIDHGWAWVGMLGYGDFLNFIGIAILAGITIFCYLAIVPVLLKQGDKVYALLAFLEAVVLAAAASGIIAAGH